MAGAEEVPSVGVISRMGPNVDGVFLGRRVLGMFRVSGSSEGEAPCLAGSGGALR